MRCLPARKVMLTVAHVLFLVVVFQVIIKVSQLLGESVVLDSSHFYESLALINSYANSDKAMTRTSE